MLLNLFFILTLAMTGLSSVAQAQDALPAGPSAFVLIARLHAGLQRKKALMVQPHCVIARSPAS